MSGGEALAGREEEEEEGEGEEEEEEGATEAGLRGRSPPDHGDREHRGQHGAAESPGGQTKWA